MMFAFYKKISSKNLGIFSGGAAVGLLMALYYVIFYFPPRLAGSNEPDRYYHLGLSQLISTQGFISSLPQAEDLGWGKYFPDKEFLFHALTGGAHWLAGPLGVFLVVPVLGVLISLLIYALLSRPLAPWKAAVLTTAAFLLSPVFLFRLTLLRPHLLAMLFFCLLLAAILRGRSWLAALAAAGFALSYHAVYIPILVIVAAAAFRQSDIPYRRQPWLWACAGLIIGLILNPYFPSNLVMSWAVIKIALGIDMPPGIRSGSELLPLGAVEYLFFFGFLPLTVFMVGMQAVLAKLRPLRESRELAFLFSTSAVLVLLSMKSSRAIEYAVPSVILLAGYALATSSRSRTIALTVIALIGTQGYASWGYYKEIWSNPQGGSTSWYLSAIAMLPPEAAGKKVFNCQWEAGSYILFARPDVRFVDFLDPALLWQASPAKYVARDRLLAGAEANPYRVLRNDFRADYVICATQGLNQQLEADKEHFEPLVPSSPIGPFQVYRIKQATQ